MIIRVNTIPKEGLEITGKFDPSDIGLDVPGHDLTEALVFSGRAAARTDDDVVVKGRLTGAMTSQCGRCLGEFAAPVDIDVDVVFTPRIESQDDRDEREWKEEIVGPPAGFSYYDGRDIVLNKEVRDIILVSLPIKPVCSAKCKGLCPGCGVDLNTTLCPCDGNDEPSPFDSLKELKEKLENK